MDATDLQKEKNKTMIYSISLSISVAAFIIYFPILMFFGPGLALYSLFGDFYSMICCCMTITPPSILIGLIALFAVLLIKSINRQKALKQQTMRPTTEFKEKKTIKEITPKIPIVKAEPRKAEPKVTTERPAPEPPKVEPGELRPSDFKIEKKIGTGGFADVYLAKDKDGNDIAVKMPRKSIVISMTFKMKQKFVQEAENWSKLYANGNVKKGIVGIYSYTLEPEPIIVMEYMDKGSLRDIMDTMTFDQKVQTMTTVLETLYDVHLFGMIHRDIKPENILFNSKGEVKIADWGLSKVLLDSGGSTTQAGMIKATLSYSSPEQIDTAAYGQVDRRSDIYQSGALAYELFTGRRPFDGDPAMVIHRILTKMPEHPSKVSMEVQTRLGDVILKAMNKVKDERWRDAMVFRDALIGSIEQQRKGV